MNKFNIATSEYLRIDYINQYDQPASFSGAIASAKKFVECAAELDYWIESVVLGFTVSVTRRDEPGFRDAPDRVFAETVLTAERFLAVEESWHADHRRRAGVEIYRFVAENYGAVIH